MSQQELEEFKEIFEGLNIGLQSKVKSILTNFQVDKERFTDIYRTYEFNLSKNRENTINASVPMEQDIIQQIEDELMKEGQKSSGKRTSMFGQ